MNSAPLEKFTFNTWTCERFNSIVKGQEIKFRSAASLRRDIKTIILPKDFKSYLTKKQFSHLESFFNSEASLRKLYTKDAKYILYSKNKYRNAFCILISFLLVYSVISSILDLAFGQTFKYQDILNFIVWALFIIDFLLNFITEKFDSRGRPIQNIKIISGLYLKGWFLIDFIALLPLGFFGQKREEKILNLVRVIKIKRIFALINIKKITKYCLRSYKHSSIKYKKAATMLKIIWEFLIEVLSILFFSFFTSCAFWFFCKSLTKNNNTSTSFIEKYSLNNESVFESLVKTMYFIFTSMATVGYGDFLPTTIYEMGFVSIILFYCTVWFTITIGKALEKIEKFRQFKRTLEEAEQLEIFITQLESMHGKIPYKLKSEIFAHFKYFWKHNCMKNTTIRVVNPKKSKTLFQSQDKILKDLPDYLRKMIFNFLFEEYYLRFRWFFPNKSSFNFKVSEYFQPRFYTDDTVIIKQNELCDEMVFISKGNFYLGFYDFDQITFVPCKSFSDWAIVGDFTLMFNRPSFATYSVFRMASGMSVPRRPIENILKQNYPMHFEYIKTQVGARSIKLLNLMSNFGFQQSEEIIDDINMMMEEQYTRVDKDQHMTEIYESLRVTNKKLWKMKQMMRDIDGKKFQWHIV